MSARIGTRLLTLFTGRHIGTDEFGNRYFQSRKAVNTNGKPRRWVMYKGIAEASKVPAAWHGWLHHTLDAPLEESLKHGWQKKHIPNLTGTTGRYLPAGHISKGGVRAPATADYEPWSPRE